MTEQNTESSAIEPVQSALTASIENIAVNTGYLQPLTDIVGNNQWLLAALVLIASVLLAKIAQWVVTASLRPLQIKPATARRSRYPISA